MRTIWIWCMADLAIQAGTIEGRVSREDGAEAGRAVIRYHRAEGGSTGAVVSDGGGRFVMEGLEKGRYGICASVDISRGALGSCEWGGRGLEVSVDDAEQVSRLGIVLRSGTLLRIRVDDPGGVLKKRGDAEPTPHIVGVFDSNGFFHEAPVGSEDGKGKEHVMLLPAGADFHISLASPVVRFRDTGSQLLRTESARRKVRGERGQTEISYQVEAEEKE